MDELNSSRDNTRASIQLLVNELHSFSKNDLLVQFSVDQVELIPALNEKLVFEDSPIFQKLYKVSTDLQKETGASVFCLANGLLEWDYLGIKTNSPLFICPAKISHDKIRKTFEVTIYQDESFINPFLQNHFQKQFEINLSELLCNEKNVEDWNAVLIDSGFNYQIQELLALGNFHHHRFSILRDLEQIAMDESTIQTNLIGLLEGKLANNQKSFILKQRLVLPANECQLELMTSLSEQNVVVQGPPGTGKSQLITNLIGRTLHDGYKTLAVSEKRVASYGIIESSFQDGLLHKVSKFLEKPSPQETLSRLGVIGKYIITPEVFDYLERGSG